MRTSRLPLLVGLAICVLMVGLTLFPSLFTNQGPYFIQSLRSWMDGDTLEFEKAPFAPSPEHVMGTDDLGRDIWSRIVYGSRLTLGLGLFVVLGRFAIALPIALSAGFGNQGAKTALRLSGILFSAIPALLICIIILQQELFLSLTKDGSTVAFVVVLSAVGWAKLGLLLEERTEDILRQPFIMSERAIGKSAFGIAMGNVVPHLAPEIVVLFFMEIARALSMIMQLGIFGVFVGNLRVVNSTDGGVITYFSVSFEPEWAGMLGTARSRLTSAPWMVIFPALAFFICVVGFNLIGEGLRERIQENRGRLHVFDKQSGKRTRIITVGVLLAGILFIAAVPGISNGNNVLPIDSFQHLLPDDSGQETAGIIGDYMRSLEMKTLGNGNYELEYDLPMSAEPINSSLTVHTEIGGLMAREGRDYSIIEFSGEIEEGEILDVSRTDLFGSIESNSFAGEFLLLDEALYNKDAVDWIVGNLMAHTHTQGIILISRGRELHHVPIAKIRDSGYIVRVSRDFAGRLIASGGPKITMNADMRVLDSKGINVVGLLPGDDSSIGDKAVLICLGYNSQGGAEVTALGLTLMTELARAKDRSRSYIFMYLDHTDSEQLHGLRAFEGSLPYGATDIELCLDLTQITAPVFDEVVFGSDQAPITRYYAWSFAHLIKGMMDDTDIPRSYYETTNEGGSFAYPDSQAANIMFWKHGIASVRFGTYGSTGGSLHLQDLGELLLKSLRQNDY